MTLAPGWALDCTSSGYITAPVSSMLDNMTTFTIGHLLKWPAAGTSNWASFASKTDGLTYGWRWQLNGNMGGWQYYRQRGTTDTYVADIWSGWTPRAGEYRWLVLAVDETLASAQINVMHGPLGGALVENQITGSPQWGSGTFPDDSGRRLKVWGESETDGTYVVAGDFVTSWIVKGRKLTLGQAQHVIDNISTYPFTLCARVHHDGSLEDVGVNAFTLTKGGTPPTVQAPDYWPRVGPLFRDDFTGPNGTILGRLAVGGRWGEQPDPAQTYTGPVIAGNARIEPASTGGGYYEALTPCLVGTAGGTYEVCATLTVQPGMYLRWRLHDLAAWQQWVEAYMEEAGGVLTFYMGDWLAYSQNAVVGTMAVTTGQKLTLRWRIDNTLGTLQPAGAGVLKPYSYRNATPARAAVAVMQTHTSGSTAFSLDDFAFQPVPTQRVVPIADVSRSGNWAMI